MVATKTFAIFTILSIWHIQPSTSLDPAVLSAIVGAGGKLLTSGTGNGGRTHVHFKGVIISADNCWKDGGGPCPSGNCLDSRGKRGVVIREDIVDCKWFCFWRASCRIQFCCEEIRRENEDDEFQLVLKERSLYNK